MFMNEEKLYYMFYKPQGYITARSDANQQTIMEFFPGELREKLFPIGRLDKDTEGLLLLTDDGMFNQSLMHPDRHVSKTYFFYAFGDINEEKISLMENGLFLNGEDKITSKAWIDIKEKGIYRDYIDKIKLKKRLRDNDYNMNRPVFAGTITITEGRKHQVKRMLSAVECKIVYLKRVAIGGLQLDEELGFGGYRKLKSEELEYVYDFGIKDRGKREY